MVIIRLARHGAKKSPFYHLTVAEKSAKRDGRFIERLGFYNPVARGLEERMRIDLQRLAYWQERGAQTSERVQQLVKQYRREQATASDAADEPAAEADAVVEAT